MAQQWGKLLQLLPNGQQQEYFLNKRLITIGRAVSNDIVLTGPDIVEYHAQIECSEDGCRLIDLGSAAGSQVNNRPIRERVLLIGDLLRFGEHRLRYEVPDVDASGSATFVAGAQLVESTLVKASAPPAEPPPPTPANKPPRTERKRTIGRYELRELLGYRGNFVIYQAYDPELDRPVAIKSLSTQFPANDELRAQISREVELIAALQHPAIMQVYDFGEHGGQPYVVLPLLQAGTLEARLPENKRLDIKELLPILERITSALEFAHQQGVIHRQISLANILFDQEGLAYIADFGISSISEAYAVLNNITQDFRLLNYISPEQAQQLLEAEPTNNLDHRTDIYSLGVVIFELLTGRSPYARETAQETVEAHLHSELPQLAEFAPDLPQPYQLLFNKLLAKNPADRFPSMAAVLQNVRELASGRWFYGKLSNALDSLAESAESKPPAEELPITAEMPALFAEDKITIGRYLLDRELGQGGMASVYLAHDPSVNRPVAVKLLPAKFTEAPQFRELFRHEAKMVANLNHEAIVSVYDFGEHDGRPYLVMQYLSGGTLEMRLRDELLPLKQVASIIKRMASALDFAHSQNIIHRDVKPANILFNAQNEPFLSDFGIATLTAAAGEKSTYVGGTPRYMSPEQAIETLGEDTLNLVEVSSRSDIYSLGVVLFQLFTGRVPFKGLSHKSTMQAQIGSPIPSVKEFNPNLPDGAQEIINKVLAKDPAERHATAGELAKEVQDLSSGRWFLRRLDF